MGKILLLSPLKKRVSIAFSRIFRKSGLKNQIVTLRTALFLYYIESLPLIIILSAVIGGIVLTVAAILIMILCRRSSALSLKAMGSAAASSLGEKAAAAAVTSSGTGTNSVVSSKPPPPTSSSSALINENARQHYLLDNDKSGIDEDDGMGWPHHPDDDGNDLNAALLPSHQGTVSGDPAASNNFDFPSRLVSNIVKKNLQGSDEPGISFFMGNRRWERCEFGSNFHPQVVPYANAPHSNTCNLWDCAAMAIFELWPSSWMIALLCSSCWNSSFIAHSTPSSFGRPLHGGGLCVHSLYHSTTSM